MIPFAFVAFLATLPKWSKLSAQSMTSQVVWERDTTEVSGRVSPDGKWLSYIDWDNGGLSVREILTGWSLKIARQGYPGKSVFSPTSDQIAFEWNNDEIRIANLKGDSSKIVISNADLHDWSPDGKSLLVYKKHQLGLVRISKGEFKSLINIQEQILHARFSPDGHWIAYTSDESGQDEVYVQTFPLNGSKGKISHQGGSFPEWRRDGKELFYVSADRQVMAASLDNQVNPALLKEER